MHLVRKATILLTASLLAAGITGCGNGEEQQQQQQQQQAPETTTEAQVKEEFAEAREETQEALSAAADFTAQKWEEYRRKTAQELDQVQVRVNEFASQVEASENTTTEWAEKQFQNLRNRAQALERELAGLRDSAEARWPEVKEKLDRRVRQLRTDFEQARNDFLSTTAPETAEEGQEAFEAGKERLQKELNQIQVEIVELREDAQPVLEDLEEETRKTWLGVQEQARRLARQMDNLGEEVQADWQEFRPELEREIEQLEDNFETARSEILEAAGTTEAWSRLQFEEHVEWRLQEAEELLEEWRRETAERAGQLTEEARQAQRNLQNQLPELRRELQELRQASLENWEETKLDVQQRLQTIQKETDILQREMQPSATESKETPPPPNTE